MWDFISFHMTARERLPNGNTLICEGDYGRVFQVTDAGEIVWGIRQSQLRDRERARLHGKAERLHLDIRGQTQLDLPAPAGPV